MIFTLLLCFTFKIFFLKACIKEDEEIIKYNHIFQSFMRANIHDLNSNELQKFYVESFRLICFKKNIVLFYNQMRLNFVIKNPTADYELKINDYIKNLKPNTNKEQLEILFKNLQCIFRFSISNDSYGLGFEFLHDVILEYICTEIRNNNTFVYFSKENINKQFLFLNNEIEIFFDLEKQIYHESIVFFDIMKNDNLDDFYKYVCAQANNMKKAGTLTITLKSYYKMCLEKINTFERNNLSKIYIESKTIEKLFSDSIKENAEFNKKLLKIFEDKIFLYICHYLYRRKGIKIRFTVEIDSKYIEDIENIENEKIEERYLNDELLKYKEFNQIKHSFITMLQLDRKQTLLILIIANKKALYKENCYLCELLTYCEIKKKKLNLGKIKKFKFDKKICINLQKNEKEANTFQISEIFEIEKKNRCLEEKIQIKLSQNLEFQVKEEIKKDEIDISDLNQQVKDDETSGKEKIKKNFNFTITEESYLKPKKGKKSANNLKRNDSNTEKQISQIKKQTNEINICIDEMTRLNLNSKKKRFKDRINNIKIDSVINIYEKNPIYIEKKTHSKKIEQSNNLKKNDVKGNLLEKANQIETSCKNLKKVENIVGIDISLTDKNQILLKGDRLRKSKKNSKSELLETSRYQEKSDQNDKMNSKGNDFKQEKQDNVTDDFVIVKLKNKRHKNRVIKCKEEKPNNVTRKNPINVKLKMEEVIKCGNIPEKTHVTIPETQICNFLDIKNCESIKSYSDAENKKFSSRSPKNIESETSQIQKYHKSKLKTNELHINEISKDKSDSQNVLEIKVDIHENINFCNKNTKKNLGDATNNDLNKNCKKTFDAEVYNIKEPNEEENNHQIIKDIGCDKMQKNENINYDNFNALKEKIEIINNKSFEQNCLENGLIVENQNNVIDKSKKTKNGVNKQNYLENKIQNIDNFTSESNKMSHSKSNGEIKDNFEVEIFKTDKIYEDNISNLNFEFNNSSISNISFKIEFMNGSVIEKTIKDIDVDFKNKLSLIFNKDLNERRNNIDIIEYNETNKYYKRQKLILYDSLYYHTENNIFFSRYLEYEFFENYDVQFNSNTISNVSQMTLISYLNDHYVKLKSYFYDIVTSNVFYLDKTVKINCGGILILRLMVSKEVYIPLTISYYYDSINGRYTINAFPYIKNENELQKYKILDIYFSNHSFDYNIHRKNLILYNRTVQQRGSAKIKFEDALFIDVILNINIEHYGLKKLRLKHTRILIDNTSITSFSIL